MLSLLMRLFLVLTFFGVLCSCAKKERPLETDYTSATNLTAAAVRPDPAFEKLAGRWERPDGGYVLEITGVESGGKLQVAYFNPGPIRVARAFALKEGDTTKLFVELQDVNYPGCTYSLKYDPQVDQLFGEYFQAALQQTFDVTFARIK